MRGRCGEPQARPGRGRAPYRTANARGSAARTTMSCHWESSLAAASARGCQDGGTATAALESTEGAAAGAAAAWPLGLPASVPVLGPGPPASAAGACWRPSPGGGRVEELAAGSGSASGACCCCGTPCSALPPPAAANSAGSAASSAPPALPVAERAGREPPAAPRLLGLQGSPSSWRCHASRCCWLKRSWPSSRSAWPSASSRARSTLSAFLYRLLAPLTAGEVQRGAQVLF